MVLVTDFDGTLVKENSTKLLESMIIRYLGFPENVMLKVGRIPELLLLGLGKTLHYKGDFKRYLLLNFFVRRFGENHLFEIMRRVAEQLTVREMFRDKEIIILSSGLKPIIKRVVEINKLNVLKIYASEVLVYGRRVSIKEITIDDKIRILEKLAIMYPVIEYCTDDIREAKLIKNKMIKVITIH